jgi:MFS family permease
MHDDMNADAKHAPPEPRVIFGTPLAWWMVLSAAFGLALGFSVFYLAIFGQLVLPVSSEFGWSLAQVTLAHTLATAISVAMAPLVGVACDRIGAWRVLATSIVLLPLAIAHIAMLQGSLVHFYIAIALVAVVGSGTLPVSYTGILLQWFSQRRGVALGCALAGVGLGVSIVPPTFQWLATQWGWRGALLVMALVMFVTMLPLGWFVLRQRPRHGEIDGGTAATSAQANVSEAANTAISLRNCYLSRPFLLLVIAFVLLGAANLSLMVNFMPILRDEGVPPAVAAWLVAMFGVAFAVTRIVTGWLLDRFSPRSVAFAITCCPALGVVLLFTVDGFTSSIGAMLLLAIGMGGEFDVMSFFIARYFPKPYYGRLYAVLYSLHNGGAVVGPLSVALYRDSQGDYSGALLYLAIAMFAAAICLFFAPHTRRHT